MADVGDFLSAFPTPPAPVRSAHPKDVVRNRANLEISSEPCQYGKCPPEHNHQHDPFDPKVTGYWPEPEEFQVGWSSQNIPVNRQGHAVPKHCVLCWDLSDNLAAHICVVVEALTA